MGKKPKYYCHVHEMIDDAITYMDKAYLYPDEYRGSEIEENYFKFKSYVRQYLLSRKYISGDDNVSIMVDHLYSFGDKPYKGIVCDGMLTPKPPSAFRITICHRSSDNSVLYCTDILKTRRQIKKFIIRNML